MAPSIGVAEDSASELGKGPLPAFIKKKVMSPRLYGASFPTLEVNKGNGLDVGREGGDWLTGMYAPE